VDRLAAAAALSPSLSLSVAAPRSLFPHLLLLVLPRSPHLRPLLPFHIPPAAAAPPPSGMPAADAAFDEVLTALAGRAGGIAPLLDAFFDFLYRRTDFFHVMSSGDKMGFPEGVAETLVMRAFKKFEDAAASARAQAGVTPAPEGATSKRSDGAPRASEPCVTGSQAVKPAVAPPGEAAMPAAPNRSSSSSQSPNRRVTSAAEASQTMPHIASARPPTLDDYNGGRTERYTWEQTLHDVTLAVPVPADTRARDVVCVIKKDQLTLKLRGAKESLIEGRFPCDARNGTEVWETVRVDDSTWSVGKLADGSPVINVYLEKSRESWWKSAIDGEDSRERVCTCVCERHAAKHKERLRLP